MSIICSPAVLFYFLILAVCFLYFIFFERLSIRFSIFADVSVSQISSFNPGREMHPGKAGSLLPQSPPHRICTVYRYPDLSLSDTRLPPGRSVAVSADLRLLPADRFRLLICISLPQIPDTAPPGQSGRSLLFCSGNFVPVSGIPGFQEAGGFHLLLLSCFSFIQI